MKKTVEVTLTLSVSNLPFDVVRDVFEAGFIEGENNGKFEDDTFENAWERFKIKHGLQESRR